MPVWICARNGHGQLTPVRHVISEEKVIQTDVQSIGNSAESTVLLGPKAVEERQRVVGVYLGALKVQQSLGLCFVHISIVLIVAPLASF